MLIPVTAGLGASGGAIAISIGGAAGQGFLVGGPIGAAIGAVQAAVGALLHRAGPAQNVATTNIVNQVEPLMRQNLAAWQSSSKSCAEYQACVQTFQQLWNAVCQNCAQPQLGDPGHSCLDDRLPAGVTFGFNTFNIVGNGKYDWFSYYLLPILNDPAAVGCCLSAPMQGIRGAPCYDPNCNAPVAVPTCMSGSGVPSFSGSGGNFNMSGLLIPALLAGLLIWAVS